MEDTKVITCTSCDGGGKSYPFCEECDGNGWVDDPSDGGTMNCPTCDNENCGLCQGSGEIEKKD